VNVATPDASDTAVTALPAASLSTSSFTTTCPVVLSVRATGRYSTNDAPASALPPALCLSSRALPL